MATLKETRIAKQLTQQEAARRIGVSLRSYIMYENDNSREDTIKYRYLLQELQKINAVDEEQLVNNEKLIHEVLKEGNRIYKGMASVGKVTQE